MVRCGNGNGKWHVGVRWVFARLRAVGAYMKGGADGWGFVWKCTVVTVLVCGMSG